VVSHIVTRSVARHGRNRRSLFLRLWHRLLQRPPLGLGLLGLLGRCGGRVIASGRRLGLRIDLRMLIFPSAVSALGATS
jgi:hypothetical protein